MEPLIERIDRIEPALPELSTAVADVIAHISAEAAILGRALHPRTAASLADLVRLMNSYYSNLIEGHNTRPWDIERALAGQLAKDEGRRNLQVEAAAHVRVQAEPDRLAAQDRLPNPVSPAFILHLHKEILPGRASRHAQGQGLRAR